MKIVGITGQRKSIKDRDAVTDFFTRLWHRKRDTTWLVMQGMCDGPDLQAGYTAMINGIRTLGVRPWAGHRPGVEWQHEYNYICKHASCVEVSDSQEFPGNHIYFARNDYIVFGSDLLVSVWDKRSGGGTAYTVNKALSSGKRVYNYDWTTGGEEWL